MKRFYSIEVKFSYENLAKELIDIEANQSKKQIEQLAEVADGEFSAFDEDIGIDKTSGSVSRLGLNYNWEFYSLDKIIQFISSLPNKYQILWIHNNDKKSNDLTYIIYSTYNKPETSKFTEEDKKLYLVILNKLKSN